MEDAPVTVRLSKGHAKDENGICQPVEIYEVPVTYDPELTVAGEAVKGMVLSFHPAAIVLREWNEQVLLHEVLHLLVRPFIAETDYNGHPTRHHEAVRELEVALTVAGWRFRPDVDAGFRESDAAWIAVSDAVESLCDCDAYRANDHEWHDPACPTTQLREALTSVLPPTVGRESEAGR